MQPSDLLVAAADRIRDLAAAKPKCIYPQCNGRNCSDCIEASGSCPELVEEDQK
jgi:hypothetical protein